MNPAKNLSHTKKFFILLLILLLYTTYLFFKYDFKTSGIVSLITWSFFVLCTPVADAGFLIDFPLRILFDIRMFTAEIYVWAIAIFINIISLIFFPHYYQTTFITKLFHKILTTPIPYWGLIVLSGIGTFLSIYFGDFILDNYGKNFFNKKNIKLTSALIIIFTLTLIIYYWALRDMNISFE